MLVELWLNSEDEELEVFRIDEQVAHVDGLACSSCLVCSCELLRCCCRSWVVVDGLKLRLGVVRVGGRAAAYRNSLYTNFKMNSAMDLVDEMLARNLRPNDTISIVIMV
ncbi:hypothetical protein Droror1_Dr00019645 [Drosera rotundifolia]